MDPCKGQGGTNERVLNVRSIKIKSRCFRWKNVSLIKILFWKIPDPDHYSKTYTVFAKVLSFCALFSLSLFFRDYNIMYLCSLILMYITFLILIIVISYLLLHYVRWTFTSYRKAKQATKVFAFIHQFSYTK